MNKEEDHFNSLKKIQTLRTNLILKMSFDLLLNIFYGLFFHLNQFDTYKYMYIYKFGNVSVGRLPSTG